EGSSVQPPTEDSEAREICLLSGMTANPWCPTRRHEWVARASESLPCSWHHLSDEGLLVVWPPEYRQWARTHGLVADAVPEAVHVSTRSSPPVNAPRERLTIVNPPLGATYLIDPTLRREFQTVAFRAVADVPLRIVWSVDDRET